MGIRLELVTDLNRLPHPAVNDLVDRSPDGTVFQRLEWLGAWWSAFGGDGIPRIYLAYDGEALVGMAPLYERWVNGRLIDVRFIGTPHSDYCTFPCLDQEYGRKCLPLLGAALIEQYRGRAAILLEEVPQASILRSWLHGIESGSRPSRLLLESTTPCPQIFDEAGIGLLPETARRKSIIRHTRKLYKTGPVQIRHMTMKQDIEHRLDSFFQLHMERWSKTRYPSLFGDERNRLFFRKMVDSFSGSGLLVFTVVELAGRPAAYHLGFLHRESFIWYKPTFDPELSRLSPGEVLLGALLNHAAEQNIRCFDFTRGDEPFKIRFANEVFTNSTYRIPKSAATHLLGKARLVFRGLRSQAAKHVKVR